MKIPFVYFSGLSFAFGSRIALRGHTPVFYVLAGSFDFFRAATVPISPYEALFVPLALVLNAFLGYNS